jgi:hypothetical protein
MASLTQSAIMARRVIRYSIYVVILLIVGRILFGLGVGLFKLIFPPPAPEPTVAFGKLPALPFPTTGSPTDINYTLETPEGNLPELPEQGIIYFMPQVTSTLSALDTARNKAQRLGFSTTGHQLPNVETVYVFSHSDLPVNLTINIVTGVFSISYDVSADPSVTVNIPPTPEAASAQVRSILSRAGLLEDDLEEGPLKYDFQKIQAGNVTEASSLSEADMIKVNLFRKAYTEDEIPAVTANPDEANVWFSLSGSRERGKEVILAEYHYFPVDEETNATYPLKTAEQAWEDLKSDKAYIARGANENVTVRRIYVGYYDGNRYSEFYQPVIVFEGDNDFVAYVPAVTDEFYTSEETTE